MPRLSTVDPSSFSQPELVKIKHVDLDWLVDFGPKTISGSAQIQFIILAKFIEEIVSDFDYLPKSRCPVVIVNRQNQIPPRLNQSSGVL